MFWGGFIYKKKILPLLKFTSGPFKLMVIMSKSQLSWEETVKLIVRGGNYNEGGVKVTKDCFLNLMQSLWIQMFYTGREKKFMTVNSITNILQLYYTCTHHCKPQPICTILSQKINKLRNRFLKGN